MRVGWGRGLDQWSLCTGIGLQMGVEAGGREGGRCSLDIALVRNSIREPCTLGRAGGRTSSLSSRRETLPKA